ncbi:MAG: GDP-mannose 4,6-dehydratase [Nanoarchaeota archaeon]
MNKRIALVTGFGMDSKTITHFLLSKGYHIFLAIRRNTVLDAENVCTFFQDDLKNYPKSQLSVLYCDVSDAVSVRTCIEKICEIGCLDDVYHLAASSLVSYSYETPLLNIQTNGLSALHFLDAIRQLSSKTRFYFAASTEMYAGNTDDEKYTEISKFHPKTPYGCSKVLGFDLTRYFRETFGLFALSGVLANHSNIYRHPSFFIRKLTQGASRIALGKEKSIKFGHLKWARDEFWADFGMEAAWKLLQLSIPQDTIIGNGNTKWGEEYVELAFNYFNLKWQDYIKFDPELLRRNEVIKLEVNPALATKTINWQPNKISFKDHIELMCKWDFDLESGRTPIRPNVFELYP